MVLARKWADRLGGFIKKGPQGVADEEEQETPKTDDE